MEISRKERQRLRSGKQEHASFGRASTIGVLVSILVFGSTVFGGFAWDDQRLIVNNDRLIEASWTELLTTPFWDVTKASDPMQSNQAYNNVYRPVVTGYLALVRKVAGLRPEVYRLLGLLVHLLVVVLAARWLCLRMPRASTGWVTLAVLFFAVHPTKTESVAWISGASDLWLGLFALTALLARECRQQPLGHALFSVCFAFALLSKETAIGVALFVIVDELLRGRFKERWKLLLPSLLVPLGLVLVLRAVALDGTLLAASRLKLTSDDLLRGLATTGHYLLRTVLPLRPTVHPTFVHQNAEGLPTYSPAALAAGCAFFLVTVSIGVAFILGRHSRGKLGATVKPIFFWFAFLMPVLGFIDVGSVSLTADRFLYLPTLGAALGILSIAVHLRDDWAWRRRGAFAFGVLIVTVGGLRAAQHVPSFYSSQAVWTRAIAEDAQNWQAMRFLSLRLAAEGKLSRAQELAAKAYTICEREARPLEASYMALVAVGLLVERTSLDDRASRVRIARALTSIPRAPRLTLRHTALAIDFELDDRRRGFILSRLEYHRTMARLLSTLGEHLKAAEQLRFASSHFATDKSLWVDRAIMLARAGDWAHAENALNEARVRAPELAGHAQRAIAAARELERRRDSGVSTSPPSELIASSQFVLGDIAGVLRTLSGETEWTAEQLSLKAEAQIADRQWSNARRSLQVAKQRFPSLAHTWQLLQAKVNAQSAVEASINWSQTR